MPLQSNLWFAAVSPADVPKPTPGYFALFISNGGSNTAAGFVHKKDSNGDVSTAVNSPDDYSDEMARDAIGSILTDSDTIRFIYDDFGNFISATVHEASINAIHLVDGAVTTAKLADQSVTTVQLADDAVTAAQIADDAVTAAHIAVGAVGTSELADSSVTDVQLADNAVTNTKLTAGAVTNSKLADNAVGNAKIADNAVSTSKLAALAVGTTNLADAAVTNVKMAQNAVNTTNIADGAVTTIKHGDASITNAKLAGASVGSANIIDTAVTGPKLALSAVATGNIVDGAVTNTKLGTDAVTNAKIADAAVNTAELSDAAVTAIKLAPAAVTTTAIVDGAVTAAKLGIDAVTNAKIADAAVSTAEIADAAVTGPKLAPTAVATANIADGAVTALKLATDAVTNAKIADAAVNTAELADNAVTTVKQADASTTTAKLADGAVTGIKLAIDAVTQAKIADSAVGTAELVDGAVTTIKIAADAITNAKMADAAVGTAELVDASVTGAKLATDAVTQVKIADAAVGTAELVDASVTAAKLGTDAVTNVKIADGAVNTAELVDTAVTNTKLATMAQATFKMRAAAAGTGAPIDGTAAQAKTALAITAADVSGLGTAATQPTTAFDAAGAATAAQAAAIAASQPLDSDLTAIAALTTTAYGRALLTLADASAETNLLNTATASLKGLMSSADKTKLDALSVATSKLRYSVTDYGITTTNTAAQNVTGWNALMGLIPDNCEVYFAPGPSPYQFASTLNIPTGKHLKIAGSSNQKSMIQTTSATADIFAVGDWYNEFDGLKFTTSVTRTAGAAINSGNNVSMNVYNCDFAGMWDGIVFTGGTNAGNLAVIENCSFTATLNRGIVLDGRDANTIIDKVIMDGASGVQQSGLELLQCGSVLVSNCDFIRSVNNLKLNPTSPNGVFSAYFVNTFFDTSPASSVKFMGTGNIQRVKFTNCWFSGSVTGCEFASTATTLPTAIDFINCDIFGNSSRGIYANGVQDFSVASSRIAGNTTAGIETNASTGGVTKFNLQNNAITSTAGFGANGTGVLVNAGTYGGYVITGNDVRNNTTATIADNGTVATTDLKVVGDNVGHLILGSIGNIAGPVTIGGSTEGVILAARIPAKAVNAGQVFRIRMFGNATGGTLIFRVRAGSAGNTGDTQAWVSVTSGTLAANNRGGFEGLLTVRTAGATGTVQAECLGFGNATLLPTVTAAVATPTVNTTNPWYITITATTSLGGGFVGQQAVVEAL